MRFKPKPKRNSEGLFKSIVLAYTILILHALLFAGIALLVLFLGGVSQYLFWILMAGLGLVVLSAYLFYRRLRREGKTLAETLRAPMFQGRSVEVSLLGGMASLRLGKPAQSKALDDGTQGPPLQLEDPETSRIREIQALADLLEKELITPEEFAKVKQKLLNT